MRITLSLVSILFLALSGCTKTPSQSILPVTPVTSPTPTSTATPSPKLSQIARAKKNWKLALLVPDTKSPFLTPIIAAASGEAKQMGVSLTVSETKNLKNLPVQNADAILVVPNVPQLPLLQAIQQNRKPDSVIVAVNSPLEMPVDGFVGPDHHQAGVLLGQAMAGAIGKNTGSVFEIKREVVDFESQSQSRLRTDGFVEGLRTLPTYQRGGISSFPHAANNASQAQFQVYMFRYNDKSLKGVFASDDELALGALKMIKPNEKIYVVGYGALPAAKKAVQSGRLLATIDPNPSVTGRNAIKLAVGLLDGIIKNSGTRLDPNIYHTPIKLIQKDKKAAQ